MPNSLMTGALSKHEKRAVRSESREASRERHLELVVIVVLLGLAIATRFLPHPPNVTAVAAAGFFAAAVFPKRWGVFLPLAAMIVSDFFLGFHDVILFTWGTMAVHGVLGWRLRTRRSATRIALWSLVGSLQFYLVTNWAVWKFSGMYPADASGLIASYLAAIPFFRNSLLGDLLFTGALFGAYEVARALVRMLRNRLLTTNN